MASRDAKGRFAKGKSGNPTGRPKAADELRRRLESGMDGAANAVLAAAEKGDMQACRLILERLLPAIRPAHAPVTFDLNENAPLADQARQILAAVARGELPPDQGRALVDAVAAVVLVVELDEIERRLNAIEDANNG